MHAHIFFVGGRAADRKIQFVMLMRGLNEYMDGITFMNKPLAIEMLRSLPERESRYNVSPWLRLVRHVS